MFNFQKRTNSDKVGANLINYKVICHFDQFSVFSTFN